MKMMKKDKKSHKCRSERKQRTFKQRLDDQHASEKKPAYLDDYIYLAEIEGEKLLLLLNEEPYEFEDAIEEKVWKDACDEEISSIERNRTWDLVDLPPRAKAIGLKWIFKIKRNSDGTINKHKVS